MVDIETALANIIGNRTDSVSRWTRMAGLAIRVYVQESNNQRAFLAEEAEKQRKWQQEENNKDRIAAGHFLPNGYKDKNKPD